MFLSIIISLSRFLLVDYFLNFIGYRGDKCEKTCERGTYG